MSRSYTRLSLLRSNRQMSIAFHFGPSSPPMIRYLHSMGLTPIMTSCTSASCSDLGTKESLDSRSMKRSKPCCWSLEYNYCLARKRKGRRKPMSQRASQTTLQLQTPQALREDGRDELLSTPIMMPTMRAVGRTNYEVHPEHLCLAYKSSVQQRGRPQGRRKECYHDINRLNRPAIQIHQQGRYRESL